MPKTIEELIAGWVQKHCLKSEWCHWELELEDIPNIAALLKRHCVMVEDVLKHLRRALACHAHDFKSYVHDTGDEPTYMNGEIAGISQAISIIRALTKGGDDE